jgi:chromosomal replication initiator protein
MTPSPKVWYDALCRLQNEIPDFAIDAWIAPLAVKIHGECLVLGCPTSFHRDRVRLHHVDAIERCWKAACAAASDSTPPGNLAGDSLPPGHATASVSESTLATSVDLLTRDEFAEASGLAVDSRAMLHDSAAFRQTGMGRMRKVGAVEKARTVNGEAYDATPQARLAPGTGVTAFHPGTHPGTAGPSDPGPLGLGHASTSLAPPGGMNTPRSTELRAVPTVPVEDRPGKRAPKVRDDSKAPVDTVAGRAVGSRSNHHANLNATSNSTPSAAASLRYSPPSRPKSDLSFDLDGNRAAADPFTFENFILGPCNALAREATLALARRRQQSLNQLYLGGGSGMGKTHLARAAASEARYMLQTAGASNSQGARSSRGARRVIYTTAEQFTSDFVSAMRNGRNDEWARRYRGAIDLLVVEDIHSFTGRTKTQEELANTISHVLDSGGRVLLTGDRAPRSLTGLIDSLRAQVSRGFVAELDRPDPLVRRHILRAKAAAGGVSLPPECLDLLVDATGTPCHEAGPSPCAGRGSLEMDPSGTALGGSVRDIESVLIQVVTTASLLGRAIDVELTREAIDLKSGAGSALEPAKLSVSEIVQIVSAFFGKRPEALASRSRRRDVLIPRQLAMYLSLRYTDASLTEIGRGLGRDHPAVRNALTRVERQILENAPLRYQVEAISERIDRQVEDARG